MNAATDHNAVKRSSDLAELTDRFNRAGAALLVIPSEYREVVATRR